MKAVVEFFDKCEEVFELLILAGVTYWAIEANYHVWQLAHDAGENCYSTKQYEWAKKSLIVVPRIEVSKTDCR